MYGIADRAIGFVSTHSCRNVPLPFYIEMWLNVVGGSTGGSGIASLPLEITRLITETRVRPGNVSRSDNIVSRALWHVTPSC